MSHAESLRPDVGIALAGNKQNMGQVQHWREYLTPDEDVETLLATVDGQALLLREDKHYYLGAQLDAAAYRRVMQRVCADAGLATIELPEGLRLRVCGEKVFAFNYAADKVSLHDLQADFSFPVTELEAAGLTQGEVTSE